MTDGNKAVQVSPTGMIQEGEVNMLRDFFERFANTVVSASEFAKQVSDLRADLETIRAEGEALRQRNALLDTELAEVREARDKARRERDQFESQATQADKLLASANAEVDAQSNTIYDLRQRIETLLKERDEAQFANIELSEAKAKAEAILNDFRARLGIPTPPADLGTFQPKPVSPDLTPTPGLEQNPAPAETTDWWANPVQPVEEPKAEPAEERVYPDPQNADEFRKAHIWDDNLRQWYYVKSVA